MNAITAPTDATAAASSTIAINPKTRTRTCWTGQDKAECLALFAQSGLRAADFCRQLGLSVTTFSLWRRHARSGEAPLVESAPHFAQVCLSAPAPDVPTSPKMAAPVAHGRGSGGLRPKYQKIGSQITTQETRY